ncbi:MAG TPA: cytochrome P450 [Myxococcota bacterium]|nr:cytochrome P450 [Myxococcota bacterium]
MIYDPYSRPFQEDPYPLYQHFRDQEPCTYNPQADFYALFRFEDVWNATLDWQTMSSSYGPSLENRGQFPSDFFSIIGMDPPVHTRLRNVISRGFTPRRIAALEPEIRGIAKHYLEPLAARDAFDFEQEFAVKFPMDVVSALLGIPEEDREQYRHAVDQGLNRDPEAAMDTTASVSRNFGHDYMARLIAARRKHPREDLVSVLAQAEYEDKHGVRRPLDEMECIAFTTLLAAAGAETTAKLLGHAIYLLWKHPDQRQSLWDDASRIPHAIEETLRYEAPSQFQGRVSLRDSTWHGVTIPAGKRVALVTGAACRDEREFPDPDRYDVTRTPARELYFGHGHHVCIGKSLARLETRIALEEIGARFPHYEVDESGITRTYQAHVKGYVNLPISTGR